MCSAVPLDAVVLLGWPVLWVTLSRRERLAGSQARTSKQHLALSVKARPISRVIECSDRHIAGRNGQLCNGRRRGPQWVDVSPTASSQLLATRFKASVICAAAETFQESLTLSKSVRGGNCIRKTREKWRWSQAAEGCVLSFWVKVIQGKLSEARFHVKFLREQVIYQYL